MIGYKLKSTHFDCSVNTSLSSATLELLIIAKTAKIITAKITLVNLKPCEDERFMILALFNLLILFFFEYSVINVNDTNRFNNRFDGKKTILFNNI